MGQNFSSLSIRHFYSSSNCAYFSSASFFLLGQIALLSSYDVPVRSNKSFFFVIVVPGLPRGWSELCLTLSVLSTASDCSIPSCAVCRQQNYFRLPNGFASVNCYQLLAWPPLLKATWSLHRASMKYFLLQCPSLQIPHPSLCQLEVNNSTKNPRANPVVDPLLCHYVSTAEFGVPIHLEGILMLSLPGAVVMVGAAASFTSFK